MTDASGMQYLRARYYAPSTGRFISRDVWQGDPMQPMGYNLWLYAYSNPVMYVDPSGEVAWWVIGTVVGAARPGRQNEPADAG